MCLMQALVCIPHVGCNVLETMIWGKRSEEGNLGRYEESNFKRWFVKLGIL